MSSGPPTTRNQSAEGAINAEGQIDWESVDNALQFLSGLDVLELATHVVKQAQLKGPKEAYNEAGSVRYQLARARKMYSVLQQTIATESYESQLEQIAELERTNAKKRMLAMADKSVARDDSMTD